MDVARPSSLSLYSLFPLLPLLQPSPQILIERRRRRRGRRGRTGRRERNRNRRHRLPRHHSQRHSLGFVLFVSHRFTINLKRSIDCLCSGSQPFPPIPLIDYRSVQLSIYIYDPPGRIQQQLGLARVSVRARFLIILLGQKMVHYTCMRTRIVFENA
jgi:hypothetical protein